MGFEIKAKNDWCVYEWLHIANCHLFMTYYYSLFDPAISLIRRSGNEILTAAIKLNLLLSSTANEACTGI